MAAPKKKPRGKVGSLAVKRSDSKFTASWKVGSSDKSSAKASDRFESIRVRGIANIISARDAYCFDASGLSTNATSRTISLNRGSWYPYTGRKLEGITVRVYGKNRKGYGPKAERRFNLKRPAAPSIGTPEFDNGTISCKFSVPSCEGGSYERERVRVIVTRTTNRSEELPPGQSVKSEVVYDGYQLKTEKSADWTYSTDEANWANFASINEYVKYEFRAIAQGYAGDTEASRKSITLSFADTPVVKSVEVGQDFVRVKFDPHPDKDNARDTAKTQLQVGYSESQTVSSWENISGAEDNGDCCALSCSRGLITPEVGQHVYFRVHATYLNEATSQTSNVVEAPELYVKPADSSEAAEDVIKVLGLVPGADGASITVQAGWADGDGYTGTEFSWSDDQDAWRSTSSPKTHQTEDASWDDGAVGAYAHSTSLKVSGLSESTMYWFRARRFDVADSTLHGGWSAAASAKTGSTAKGVVASIPAMAVKGTTVVATWAIGGGGEQRSWSAVVNGSTIAASSGSATSFEIGPAMTEGESLTFEVLSDIDGTVYRSGAVSCSLVDMPSCTVSSEQIISAAGHTASVDAEEGTTVSLRLLSCGVSDRLPDGERSQQDGEVVWSETILAPATVTIGGELIDGSQYRLVGIPVKYGISGPGSTASWVDADGNASDRMTVAWAHQAAAPEASVAVDGLSAVVEIAPAADAVDSDVLELYRIEEAGASLIASCAVPAAVDGVRPHVQMADAYPALGDLQAYRVCTLTADGDRDYVDCEYSLPSDAVTIDWQGGQLTIPYGVTITRNSSKEFESVSYLDGSIGGGWSAKKRSMKVDFSMLRSDTGTVGSAIDLMRYKGACFVRTPDGAAFPADVAVDSISAGSESMSVATASLTITEVDSDEFMLGSDDVVVMTGA